MSKIKAPTIKALGYLGCNVRDLGAWNGFMSDVFSLQGASDSAVEVRHFDLEGRCRVSLRQADEDALSHIGWEVETRGDLQHLEDHLSAHGVAFERGDPALCNERGVTELIVLSGPDGVRTELFISPPGDDRQSTPGGSHLEHPPGKLRLGHVVLACEDRSASVDWYRNMFGFSVSDHIFWDGVEASFLRCSSRHHSLALTNRVGDMRAGDLGHFMLEGSTMDEVGSAYDVVRKRGIPVAFTLGRHSNDNAFSFYVYAPSGWLVEYGFGGRLIEDPAWETRLYDAPSIWGHELQPPPGGDHLKQRY